MDSASNETTLPKGLEGLVVVELGDYVAMPACPRLLGELGATVYKIETLTGNLHRLDGPGFGMPELGMDNPAFDMSNANKNFSHSMSEVRADAKLRLSCSKKLIFLLRVFAPQALNALVLTTKRFISAFRN